MSALDINFLYPLPKDFIEHNEIVTPQLFNYACFRGRQVFLRSFRKRFQIVVRGFIPKGYDFQSDHDYADMLHRKYVYSVKEFPQALYIFRNICNQLFTLPANQLELMPCV